MSKVYTARIPTPARTAVSEVKLSFLSPRIRTKTYVRATPQRNKKTMNEEKRCAKAIAKTRSKNKLT